LLGAMRAVYWTLLFFKETWPFLVFNYPHYVREEKQ
jgi:hypothetical protein